MNVKKKISIIGPCHPYRGGNALFVTHLYHSLVTRFDIQVVNYSLLYPDFLFPGTTQFDRSLQPIRPVPNERLVNSINPVSWIQTAKHIESYNPDLVVFDWWNPFFGPSHFSISAFLKKRFKDRMLFITENVISHEGRWIDRVLTRLGLRYASAFMALSDNVVHDLDFLRNNRKVYRSELPIYGCYDNLQKFKPENERKSLGYNENDKIVLFFGYVRTYKGLDLLLHAFPDVTRSIPDAKLLIVGEFYDDPKTYLSLIKELNLESCVKIINRFVPNEEVGKYYSAADVVVLPYRTGTQSGILNVAYGCERPVIVTDVGGLAESVEHELTGLVVEPDSSQAISNGIKKFFEIRNSINFSEHIRRKVQSNLFSNVAELFETIIQETKP
ncbi:glycosyltransferase [bacterium]|nr:glycosyltransferase [bacterium]